DKRVVSEKWGSPCPTSPGFGIGSEEEEEEEEADHMFTFRMGKRMQLAVTMDNKAKVSREEDSSYTPVPSRARGSSARNVPRVSLARAERMQIAITMDNKEKVSASPGDLSFPMTGRERSEYIRWKRERDQIDLERLARHKNAKGEWRRAWDVEKS
ncbi:CCD9B protein, partial [Mystacornis crossleyi]|nr:CCD9B protein [Mystacornis crossleyi]